MLICNRCRTSILDGARFCPACGDPVTAGDRAVNQAVPGNESVQLACPHCEHPSLFSIPSDGVAQLTCSACATLFDVRVVRVRAKRSTGPKHSRTRAFWVRVESLDGREQLMEFVRPKNEDFELRSKDLAAFSSIDGELTLVENLSVGQRMKLVFPPIPPAPAPATGCAGAVLLWIVAAASAGALLF
jgi:zinc-ribbon domain